MFKIELSNWYQELRKEGFIQKEFYHNLDFDTIENACKFLGENAEKICDEYPVESIEIRFVKND